MTEGVNVTFMARWITSTNTDKHEILDYATAQNRIVLYEHCVVCLRTECVYTYDGKGR